ncbi:MAG: UbiA family prenyltransferase [Myxococcota bacterium]|jgi:4-hydroxybenzoate polyprenyltransferase|nr:UbiA family prenyltransferase [Myxococcota bacterium]
MRRKPYPIASTDFWKAYWITLRPYLFFLSGAVGLTGLALAPVDAAWLAICGVAFFLTYGLGQALTDVFQTDTDTISSPYRPLTQGLIGKPQVLVVSLLGLLGCSVVLTVSNPWNAVPAVLGVIGLSTYTPMKRRFWAGPAWNSAVVALLPLMGAMCGGADPLPVLRNPTLWGLMGSAFGTYAVFVILGYHKDVAADRATGYHTVTVRFGWRPSVIASAAHGTAGLAASLLALWMSGAHLPFPSLHTVAGGAMWVCGALAFGVAHGSMWRVSCEQDAHPAIAWCIRGFVLVHLAEAVMLRPALLLVAMPFYAAFELVLRLRPEKTQI